MTIFEGIILGVVQGLTEFLPVSSSGHLIITRQFFNSASYDELLFDVLLHIATLLVIVIYFRKDIYKILKSSLNLFNRAGDEKSHTLLFAIIIGSIPAVFFGFFFEDFISNQFRSIVSVSIALILGSILFYIAERYATQTKELSAKKGWWIGWFQALALIPGISRSGASISGGLLLGLKREEAARFSFLLALPVFTGAGIKKILELESFSTITVSMIVGFVAAFVVGFIAIHFLIKYLKHNSLSVFIWYRVILAFLLLVFFV